MIQINENTKTAQPARSTAAPVTALICLAGFFVVLLLLLSGRLAGFDAAVAQFFYDLRRPWLTKCFTAVTYLGNWQTIVACNIVMLIVPMTRKSFGIPCSLAALLGYELNRFVKHCVLRIRPDKSLHLISQGGYSFPSGHAMTGLVFYGMLAYRLLCTAQKNEKRATQFRVAAAFLCILIFLIGLSRIYLGVHYPSDVLAGWLLGGAFLAAFISLLSYASAPSISSADSKEPV